MGKRFQFILMGGVIGIAISNRIAYKKEVEKKIAEKKFAEKNIDLFLMMNQWVKVNQEGKKIVSYFEKHGYKRIAIYGMGVVGVTLLNELKKTSIKVVYGIDKDAEDIYAEVNIVTLDGLLDEVDAVVVTAISYFDEIKKILSRKVACPVVSLEDILYEV